VHCRLVGHLFFKLRFFLVGTYCCLLCAHCVRLVLSSPPNADGDCFQFGTPSAGITWTGNNITINTTRYNIILLLYCLRFSSSANVYVDFSYLENSCLRAFCLFYPLFTLGYVSFRRRELVDSVTVGGSTSVLPWKPERCTMTTSRAKTMAVRRAEYPDLLLYYWLLLIFTSAASTWNPCITSEPRVCITQYIKSRNYILINYPNKVGDFTFICLCTTLKTTVKSESGSRTEV